MSQDGISSHNTAVQEPLELSAPEEHKLLPAPSEPDAHDGEHRKRKGSKRTVLLFVVAVVLILLLILFLGWLPRHNQKKAADAQAAQQKDALPVVTVVKVLRDNAGSGLAIPGTSTPLTQAYVYARATGYLTKRFVDIGDRVHKGQLLAILDAPDLDQQVDQAREQLRQAEAQKAQGETQLALYKVTFDRYAALVAKGVFSRQDGDQAEANYLAQVANVAAADRNIEAFRANLRRTLALQSYERVTSPFDGTITERNVDVGALIQASGSAGTPSPTPTANGGMGVGSQAAASNTGGASGNSGSLATPTTGGAQGGALFGIAQTQRLRILVSVPAGYADFIRVGQPTTLFFQEYPQTAFHGNVTRTAGTLDENTRTLVTEIQVDNRDGRLKSGMYTVVTFGNKTGGPGPLIIPGDAVGIRQDRPTVAVVENNIIHLQPVTIGRDFGPEIEITGGLKEGDLIATTITDEVIEGAHVHAEMDKKPPKLKGSTQQAQPPGGSTQYADPGVTDADSAGKNSKPSQKGNGNGAAKKGNSNGASKP